MNNIRQGVNYLGFVVVRLSLNRCSGFYCTIFSLLYHSFTILAWNYIEKHRISFCQQRRKPLILQGFSGLYGDAWRYGVEEITNDS